MAMSAPRSSVFTFESTVHSFHVLRGLDEQRRRDMLCDVTVVAEGQSFRAHRSVLASCSEYFAHRISPLTQQGAVVTLPEEVTADGFEPLLNFAYTSKLFFGKENALEIRNAASVLGFRDLDEACFDFVLPKFSASSAGSASSVRKTCCKKKCKRRLSKAECGSDSDSFLLDEKEVKPVADSSSQQEALWVCDKLVNNKMGSQSSTASDTPAVEQINDLFMQCPKYRKFQLACGKESCSVGKSVTDSAMAFSEDCSPFCSPCSSRVNTKKETELHPSGNFSCEHTRRGADGPENTEIHEKTKSCSGKEEARMAQEGTQWKSETVKNAKDVKPLAEISSSDISGGKPIFPESNVAQSESSAGLTLNHCPSSALDQAPEATGSLEQEGFVLDIKGKKASDPGAAQPVSVHKNQEEKFEAEERDAVRTSNRMEMSGNIVEQRHIDMTQKLATWPGQDACSSKEPTAESPGEVAGRRGTSLDWLKLHSGFSTAGTSCPFFQNLDQRKCLWKGTALPECEVASQSGVSSLNSGEDGDSETETEGDSESYARERARQVQLPFSVDWVVNLNRNDFQQLLKQQVFTREQLEFVHDMRRRSKNRLAAQRCRKRKLDCIYNLQCEINKLKTEREKLVMEKSQLNQMKLKTCHSVSALCQRVCSEANLQPEQLHVLAKYTSPDCPLSSLFPHIDALLSQHGKPHGLAPDNSPSSPSTDTIAGPQ